MVFYRKFVRFHLNHFLRGRLFLPRKYLSINKTLLLKKKGGRKIPEKKAGKHSEIDYYEVLETQKQS